MQDQEHVDYDLEEDTEDKAGNADSRIGKRKRDAESDQMLDEDTPLAALINRIPDNFMKKLKEKEAQNVKLSADLAAMTVTALQFQKMTEDLEAKNNILNEQLARKTEVEKLSPTSSAATLQQTQDQLTDEIVKTIDLLAENYQLKTDNDLLGATNAVLNEQMDELKANMKTLKEQHQELQQSNNDLRAQMEEKEKPSRTDTIHTPDGSPRMDDCPSFTLLSPTQTGPESTHGEEFSQLPLTAMDEKDLGMIDLMTSVELYKQNEAKLRSKVQDQEQIINELTTALQSRPPQQNPAEEDDDQFDDAVNEFMEEIEPKSVVAGRTRSKKATVSPRTVSKVAKTYKNYTAYKQMLETGQQLLNFIATTAGDKMG
ncbi:PREDICTED: uncharacterized protein LOC105950160 [Erythranthe guttata]|uniref:uncharacterized protein LOC105950160 n=1 Tax=Erythranthe guttata TaxID=4155 RepID=UPI00064DA8E9|nr:PREDICTED: uncharacterized protein LOC105950160 [Erythranthe guttata]|eukprot:XP_012828936.1 PREDICTED: uncharacterized protein LOC105950160 [Erythranthe guttata]